MHYRILREGRTGRKIKREMRCGRHRGRHWASHVTTVIRGHVGVGRVDPLVRRERRGGGRGAEDDGRADAVGRGVGERGERHPVLHAETQQKERKAN